MKVMLHFQSFKMIIDLDLEHESHTFWKYAVESAACRSRDWGRSQGESVAGWR